MRGVSVGVVRCCVDALRAGVSVGSAVMLYEMLYEMLCEMFCERGVREEADVVAVQGALHKVRHLECFMHVNII
jgi:hypothetical protein